MLAILLLACAVGSLAAPVDNQQDLQALSDPQPAFRIISKEDVVNADGSFNYNYETSNGIKVETAGSIKRNPNPPIDTRSGGDDGADDGDILTISGSYSYPAPDGTIITVRYIADENGFQPMGDHLPAPHANFVRAQNAQGDNSGFASRSGIAADTPDLPPTQQAAISSKPAQAPKQPEQAPSQPDLVSSQPEQVPTVLPGSPLGEQAALVDTEESELQKELEQ